MSALHCIELCCAHTCACMHDCIVVLLAFYMHAGLMHGSFQRLACIDLYRQFVPAKLFVRSNTPYPHGHRPSNKDTKTVKGDST